MQKDKFKEKKSTTIAISIEDSTLVEEYCKKYEILKKDFVGLAVRWFLDNNIDIRSEVSFAPVTEAKEVEKQHNQVEALCCLMTNFISAQQEQLQQFQLPDNNREKELERLTMLVEDNKELMLRYQDRLERDDEEKRALRKEIASLSLLLEKAKNELRHCKGLFSSADERVLKELGL